MAIGMVRLAGAVAILLVAAFLLLAGTDAGTRFIADRIVAILAPELTIERTDGTLLSSIGLSGVRWSDDGLALALERADLRLSLPQLLRLRVQIESARGEGVVVELMPATAEATGPEPFRFELPLALGITQLDLNRVQVITADVNRNVDTVFLSGELVGSDLAIDRLDIRADWLDAEASGELLLRTPYRADAQIKWSVPLDPTTLSGAGSVTGDRAGYAIRHALNEPLAIDSVGELVWEDEPLVRLVNQWSELVFDLPDSGRITSERGQVDVIGWLDAFRFEANAAVNLLPEQELRIVARGSGDLKSLRIAEGELRTDDGSAKITGPVTLTPDRVAWDAQLTVAELGLAQLWSELNGSANFVARSAGALEGWREPNFNINLGTVSGDLFGKPLSGGGAVVVKGSTLQFDGLALGVAGNRVAVTGRIGPELDLRADIDAARLADALPDLAGRLRGSVVLKGTAEMPRVQASLRGDNLSYAQWWADVVTVNSRTMSGGQRLELSAQQVRGGDILAEEITLVADGELPAHSLMLRGRSGASTVEIALDASLRDRAWNGRIATATVNSSDAGNWTSQAPAAIHVDPRRQSIDRLCMQRDGGERLCIQLANDGDRDTQVVDLDLEAFPIGPFIERAEPQLIASGALAGGLALVRAKGDLNGTIDTRLDSVELRLRPDPDEPADSASGSEDVVTFTAELRGKVEDNRLRLTTELDVAGAGSGRGSLSLADIRTPRDTRLAADAEFGLDDVSFVSWFWESFTVNGGRLAGDLSVGGSLATPELSGSARVTDAALAVSAAGIELNDVQLSASADDSRAIELRASAESGNGRLELAGRTRVDIDAGLPTELTLRGNDVEVIRVPGWSVFASPDLKVSATMRAALITGTVLVPTAAVEIDRIPETAATPSPDAIVHSADAPATNGAYNYDIAIAVVAGDSVRLKGFGLDTRLTGELDLSGGRRQQFRGNGELKLVDGTFDAYGQSLTIDRGLILFAGALDNPLLDFRASREIDTVSVGIELAGPAVQPQSSLFSSPPMSDASALSYLLTGRPLPEADSKDGDLISGAAIGLGLSQAKGIIAESQTTLGLDELAIEGGTSDGRVLAGKRLGNKLYLRYAYGVFDQVGSLLLRYRLTDSFVIESESGAEQSLDIVYSKESD